MKVNLSTKTAVLCDACGYKKEISSCDIEEYIDVPCPECGKIMVDFADAAALRIGSLLPTILQHCTIGFDCIGFAAKIRDSEATQ